MAGGYRGKTGLAASMLEGVSMVVKATRVHPGMHRASVVAHKYGKDLLSSQSTSLHYKLALLQAHPLTMRAAKRTPPFFFGDEAGFKVSWVLNRTRYGPPLEFSECRNGIPAHRIN